MGFAELLRPVATSLVDFFGDGETIELRALTRLYDRMSQAAIPAGGLELAAPASMGAASLTLRRPASARLGGKVWEGASLSIAGDATAYQVAADAEVIGTSDQLAVTVTPALTASAAAGAVVTLGNYGAYTYPRARTEFESKDVDNERVFGDDNVFVLSCEGGQPAPQEGWIVAEVGQEVVHVETVAPGAPALPVAWILHTGRGR